VLDDELVLEVVVMEEVAVGPWSLLLDEDWVPRGGGLVTNELSMMIVKF